MRIGYTLMSEQSGPRELVQYAARAEQAGFDFEVMSDHYFPWLEEQGHSGYAWATLGAVSQVTERVDLMTYVTCPTMRYHPAEVAQKAATVQLLSGEHFRVDSARIWDLPEKRVPLAMAVSGSQSIELLAPQADHLVAVEPGRDLVEEWKGATQFVRPEDVASSIPCGPDVEPILQSVEEWREAGFTDLALVQIGDEGQTDFLDFAEKELLPALRERGLAV